jgi:hypothetical protein
MTGITNTERYVGSTAEIDGKRGFLFYEQIMTIK